MKLVPHFALLVLLPFLSGCISGTTIDAANRHSIKIKLYDSADRIQKAAVTKDGQLCIFFEKDLTNSGLSRFALAIPLAQVATNVQSHAGFITAGILRDTNHYDLYPRLSPATEKLVFANSEQSTDKTNPLFYKCTITSATLHVTGGIIRTNWEWLDNSKNDLRFIPVGPSLIVGDSAVYHGLELTLLSNATQTVYLTKTNPIEFVYIDASIKRSLTIITVDPTVIAKTQTEHPGYYFLLPLTVPLDIATSPIQLICAGIYYLQYLSGDNPFKW